MRGFVVESGGKGGGGGIVPPKSFRTTTRRCCLVPRRSRRLLGEKPLGAERMIAFLSVLCLLFLLVLVYDDYQEGKEKEMVVVRVSIAVVICIERR